MEQQLIWNGQAAEEEGSCGIVDYDGEWEAQAMRFRVGDKIVFVIDAAKFDAGFLDDNSEFETNRRDPNHPLNQGDDEDGQDN